jgi:hypothetical protein
MKICKALCVQLYRSSIILSYVSAGGIKIRKLTLCLYPASFFYRQYKVRTYKEYPQCTPLVGIGTLPSSQPLSSQRVFPSPQKQGGGGTLACGWEVGGSPNSDEGHTLWYSLYVRTLCIESIYVHLPDVRGYQTNKLHTIVIQGTGKKR